MDSGGYYRNDRRVCGEIPWDTRVEWLSHWAPRGGEQLAEKNPTPFNVLSVTAEDPVDETPSTQLGPSQSLKPPVVARLVVEIRSDGSRTIARGALEDLDSGDVVTVEAHGRSPASLAWSLAKTVANAPALMRHRPNRELTQTASARQTESSDSQEPRNKTAQILARLRTHIKKTRRDVYDRIKRRVVNKQDIDRLESSE